ncbi:hypothetical protein [Desulfovibrio inopinatus]|uniref:hypothetical protein n=1 Tax=Desulfovibrio inopinatus TaxID=102109 RepID=UPI0004218EB4|nr:hypothetical protein [Desulfovibrio inopinatus]
MTLDILIESIITEGSGLVIASFRDNLLDAHYVEHETLLKKRVAGDFGSQWSDKSLEKEDTCRLLADVGLDFDGSDYAVFEDMNGDRVIVIKDHRVLLHGANEV